MHLKCHISGSKTYRHILAPEVEGGDEMDPVTALAWDPLSTDYLLVANKHCGVRLIDATARAVIMSFQLPSSAAEIQTLCWVHNAPGMFVTGGKWASDFWNMAHTIKDFVLCCCCCCFSSFFLLSFFFPSFFFILPFFFFLLPSSLSSSSS